MRQFLIIIAIVSAAGVIRGGSTQYPDQGTSTVASDGHSVVLTRAPNGHFYTTAMVNGHPIHFMIDTGASMVALSREDAEKAGIAISADKFVKTAEAASGEVRYMPVTLDTVDIGNLEIPGVEAAVLDGEVRGSLLGQSWLSRLKNVQIENDRMTLR